MRDLSQDNNFLSINTTTLRKQGGLATIVDGVARAGIPGISPWRDQAQACGIKKAARLVKAHGLTVTGYCRGGWFTSAGKAGLRAALDDNRRAVDEAAALGASSLVVVVGGLLLNSRDLKGTRALVREALAELLPYARAAGIPLALEPLHPMHAAERACINTLAQANDLCDELGAGIGLAVDVYHVWWDPDLAPQIARARGERLLAFHLCDWLIPTRDMLYDRGMMGDGCINIPYIRGLMEDAGYRGFCEVEILSKFDWWRRPINEVLATCIERYRTVC